MLQFAEQLATITPQGLDMMFFHSSAIIAFRGAFHGRTTGALALTSSKALYRRGHGPFMPGVYIAPYATPFGCPTGGRRDGCAEACLQQLDTLFAHEVDPSQVAAMFVEPILGEGGYIDPPPAFLQRLRRRWRLCR